MPDLESLITAAKQREREFFERMEMSRSQIWRLPDRQVLNRIDSELHDQPARSLDARLVWATAVINGLDSFFDFSRNGLRDSPLWHFTLVDRNFCVPPSVWMPTDRLPEMLDILPERWNTFGFFEPGYYYNLAAWSGSNEPCFSWHAHGFLWGPKPKAVKEATRQINREICGIGDKKAFLAKRISVASFPQQLAYIFKPPLREYMVWKPERLKDGRVCYLQRARKSGPSNLVRSWCQLQGRSLDELAFASGEGHQVQEKVRSSAGSPSRFCR